MLGERQPSQSEIVTAGVVEALLSVPKPKVTPYIKPETIPVEATQVGIPFIEIAEQSNIERKSKISARLSQLLSEILTHD